MRGVALARTAIAVAAAAGVVSCASSKEAPAPAALRGVEEQRRRAIRKRLPRRLEEERATVYQMFPGFSTTDGDETIGAISIIEEEADAKRRKKDLFLPPHYFRKFPKSQSSSSYSSSDSQSNDEYSSKMSKSGKHPKHAKHGKQHKGAKHTKAGQGKGKGQGQGQGKGQGKGKGRDKGKGKGGEFKTHKVHVDSWTGTQTEYDKWGRPIRLKHKESSQSKSDAG